MSALTSPENLATFFQEFQELITANVETGAVHFDDANSARSLAKDLAAKAVDRQQRLNNRFGQFCSSERARRDLGGITRQALHARVTNNRLLRVTTSDDRKVYPAAQFDGQGKTLKGLPKLLQVLLPSAADEWVVLYWLTAQLSDFDGRTAFEVLRDEDVNEVKDLLKLAAIDAANWDDVAHAKQRGTV